MLGWMKLVGVQVQISWYLRRYYFVFFSESREVVLLSPNNNDNTVRTGTGGLRTLLRQPLMSTIKR